MAKYELTMEQLQAAKEAKSPEELVAKAKKQGYDITLQRAAEFLDMPLEDGDVSDEELDNVAGGHGGMCHNNGREVVTLITPCVHGLKANFEAKFVPSAGGGAWIQGGVRNIGCGDAGVPGTEYRKSDTNSECKYLSYEKGLWLCNYPEHLKK